MSAQHRLFPERLERMPLDRLWITLFEIPETLQTQRFGSSLDADLSWLSDEERARASQYRTTTLRQQFLIHRYFARVAIEDCLQIPVDQQVWNARGRPIVRSREGDMLAAISVSHTLGLIGVCVGPIGVNLGLDLEQISHINAFPGFDNLVLSESERQLLRETGASLSDLDRIRIFSAKEAAFKSLEQNHLLNLSDIQLSDRFTSSLKNSVMPESEGSLPTTWHAPQGEGVVVSKVISLDSSPEFFQNDDSSQGGHLDSSRSFDLTTNLHSEISKWFRTVILNSEQRQNSGLSQQVRANLSLAICDGNERLQNSFQNGLQNTLQALSLKESLVIHRHFEVAVADGKVCFGGLSMVLPHVK